MDTETDGRITDYLEVYDRVNPVVKHAEVTATIIEQIGKDTRCERLMNGRSNGHASGEQPATAKQLGYLRALNVEIPEGLTKQAASELIDQHAG